MALRTHKPNHKGAGYTPRPGDRRESQIIDRNPTIANLAGQLEDSEILMKMQASKGLGWLPAVSIAAGFKVEQIACHLDDEEIEQAFNIAWGKIFAPTRR